MNFNDDNEEPNYTPTFINSSRIPKMKLPPTKNADG